MPRPKTEDRPPRMVTRGLVVRSQDGKYDEVVRGVSIVLHLANGTDQVYAEDDVVAVLVDQPALNTPEVPPEEGQ